MSVLLRVEPEKYLKHRNALIEEVIEEMGHDEAKRYFSVEANRKAIEEIATQRAFWEPKRNLDLSVFRKNKWKKKEVEEPTSVI